MSRPLSKRMMRRLVVALVVGVILALAGPRLKAPAAPAVPEPPTAVSGRTDETGGTVTRVYDGDTIEVSGVGRVRLLGIDAPDGYNLERALAQAQRYGLAVEGVKAWADRATEFSRQTLKGRRVVLQYGEQRTDDFDRTLAYVHAEDGQDVNLALLRRGFAAAYRDFDHPRRDLYLWAEAEARAARIGMWQDAAIGP